ncbi:Extracellular Matrix protein PelD [Labilithrix luteola]|uniref:Extracellular Matrix protein PelD n=1 Tax=Labilithrix luteola TaxID=1391654 RepID=A0A0K1PJL3_9BACT|nr:Extracellular Matrix protein PelD [Labilithrix luteola]
MVDHANPFFLTGGFPWLALAPLLIALRHGFMLGFGSAVLLDVGLVLAWRLQFVPVARFPGEPLVGLIVVAMIAGQFSDLWKREIVALEFGFQGLRRQSNELARAHFLLEVSHDRLDDKVERSRSTLREAMSALRDAMSAASTVSFAIQGNTMLEIFATHCGLEVGELLSVNDGALGDRCAVVGRPEAMAADDPLLVHALRTGQLTYIPAATRPDRSRNFARTPLLAAIPFVDSSGEIMAVMCVQAMPFISFEKRNLETMATLGGHLADVVRTTRATNEASAIDSAPSLDLAGGAEGR